MLRLTKLKTKTLSAQISLKVVLAIAILLTAALLVMFRYTRKAMKQEAMQKAEQTLEAMAQQIDNILLSVEQSTGNIYWDVLTHLGQPERMALYSRKLVETNPYVSGGAIAFEPYYYKDRGQYFMTYVHRSRSGKLRMTDSPIIQASTFGNKPYPEQIWYRTPLEKGRPYWLNPVEDTAENGEAITSFCLPIYQGGQVVGVLGVDISLALLSEIVLDAKPSPNSYAMLVDGDGFFIVHPDTSFLSHRMTSLPVAQASPDVMESMTAMTAGETGYRHLKLRGVDSYVFFKPFQRKAVQGRSLEDMGWSICIVYPTDDIFGEYNHLLYIVLAIAIAGLLLLLLLTKTIIHRQLRPLSLLTRSAQRIADGHYDEPIPDSQQSDEVGALQDHFQKMQQALATHVGELERLKTSLQEQGEGLSEAYRQAKEADRMKTAVLHNMTNQMSVPVSEMTADVETIREKGQTLTPEEVNRLVDGIGHQGKVVTDLLNDLLEGARKES